MENNKETATHTPFSAAMSYFLAQKDWGGDTVYAKKIKLSQGYISELSRGIKNGHENTRRRIANSFDLPYDLFLRLGELILSGIPGDEALRRVTPIISERQVTTPAPRAQREVEVEEVVEPITRVPLISFVQAGDWCSAVDQFHPGDAEEWVPYPGRLGSHAFALRVNGPSMEPRFVEGDVIVVDPDRDYVSGDFVIAKNGNDEATFKRFYRDGDRCFLVPLNANWGPPMEMTGKDWKVIGRVVGKLDLF